VAGATAGRIVPGDVTWRKLIAAVPQAFSDLRVLTTSKTVFVAATAGQRDASVARSSQLTFEPAFRNSVIAVIRRLYERWGAVCSVCRDGDRRTFQTQYDLLTSGRGVTRAGPGESNHNFGQGVDLGFQGLRWIRANGTVVENEDWWMHQLDPGQLATGEALIFWNALREAGTQAGLFRGPVSDRPHLQAWSDAGIDMADRLADLLTRAGRMRWTGRAQRYQCDLGFGGRFFDVGSAAQVWNKQATITEATITEARAQAAARPAGQPAAQVPAGVGARAPAAAPQTGTRPAVPAVTAQDVTAMRTSLRDDFVAADAAWPTWRAR
jgi:hypothetical protein